MARDFTSENNNKPLELFFRIKQLMQAKYLKNSPQDTETNAG